MRAKILHLDYKVYVCISFDIKKMVAYIFFIIMPDLKAQFWHMSEIKPSKFQYQTLEALILKCCRSNC